MTNRDSDPVWQAFKNAKPRTAPISPELHAMAEEGRRAVLVGDFVPRAVIQAVIKGAPEK